MIKFYGMALLLSLSACTTVALSLEKLQANEAKAHEYVCQNESVIKQAMLLAGDDRGVSALNIFCGG